MPFLLKLILAPAINFLFELLITILREKVKDTKSPIDDNLVAAVEGEKEELKKLILSKSKETGIYKKLMKGG